MLVTKYHRAELSENKISPSFSGKMRDCSSVSYVSDN